MISFFHCHIWVHNISTVFILFHPLFISSLLPLVPAFKQYLFYLPVFPFWKKKFLFKIAIQAVSLWHFHVYMYACIYIHICMYICTYIYIYTPEMLHPLNFSPFYFSTLLKVISTDLSILYSGLYSKYVSYIHFFTFFFYPSPINTLYLVWPVLYSCPSLFRCLFSVQGDFCLEVIAVHAFCNKSVFYVNKTSENWYWEVWSLL
jgi:hypothetical protein